MKEKNLKAIDELYELYDRIPRAYIEQNLKIKNPEGKIVPFIFNEPQRIIDEEVQKMIKDGKPVRIIVVKARREGTSTLFLGYGFEKVVRHENMNALIVAHEPEATSDLFDVAKLFYDELPEDERPMKKYDNKKQLSFENPDEFTKKSNPGLRSKIKTATASKIGAGRGGEIHFLHLSEASHYPNADQLMLSLLPAVHDNPGTYIVFLLIGMRKLVNG